MKDPGGVLISTSSAPVFQAQVFVPLDHRRLFRIREIRSAAGETGELLTPRDRARLEFDSARAARNPHLTCSREPAGLRRPRCSTPTGREGLR